MDFPTGDITTRTRTTEHLGPPRARGQGRSSETFLTVSALDTELDYKLKSFRPICLLRLPLKLESPSTAKLVTNVA